MASVCLSQNNYQHFQIMNGNMMLLQQNQFKTKNTAQPHKSVLGTSKLQNIQKPANMGGVTMETKKKYTYSNMPYGEQLPSVARRNARERNRVKQVNNGFANLRQHLPQSVINVLSNGGRGASKKLSKVDTLRIAVEYIRGLQDMLDGTTKQVRHVEFDDSSNDGSSYDFSTMSSLKYQSKHLYHSEASASPTPSFSDSDISIGGSNFLHPVKTEVQPEFKFETFSSYNNLTSDDQPDDEELLDYISSWQEQ